MALQKGELTELVNGAQVNSATSGNRTEEHPLLRMKLAWQDEEYRFAVNPEDYTQSEPNKVTVTQTKGGAWIDAWGEGLKEITLKGTTGMYAHRGSDGRANPDAGYQRWKNLRNLIQHVYDAVQDGEEVELMRLYNYTDNEYFYVYPAQGGIELYRSKARPNLYQYTLRLICIRRIGQPEKERQVQGDPGKVTREQRAKDRAKLDAMIEDYRNGGDTELAAIVSFANEHAYLFADDEPDEDTKAADRAVLEEMIADFRNGGKTRLTDIHNFVDDHPHLKEGSDGTPSVDTADQAAIRETFDRMVSSYTASGQPPLTDIVQFTEEHPFLADSMGTAADDDTVDRKAIRETFAQMNDDFKNGGETTYNEILDYVNKYPFLMGSGDGNTGSSAADEEHIRAIFADRVTDYRAGGDTTLAEIIALVQEYPFLRDQMSDVLGGGN